jgi:hypothetical protein
MEGTGEQFDRFAMAQDLCSERLVIDVCHASFSFG